MQNALKQFIHRNHIFLKLLTESIPFHKASIHPFETNHTFQ